MRVQSWYALSSVGLLMFAGCAGQQKQAAQNPTAQRVETAQKQTQEQLKAAQEAQKEATKQQQVAAQAQQKVQEDQQKLQQDQQRAQEEIAKAQQAQKQANALTKQATDQVHRNQQQATAALNDESQRVQSGIQSFAGMVSQSSKSSLQVMPPSGDAMTFRITPQTQIVVDGRQGTMSKITPGADARVAYDLSGPTPTAQKVLVTTGKVTGSSGTGTGGGSSRSSGGTASGSGGTGSSSGGNTPASGTGGGQ
jgi:hypothetical protein